MFEYVMRQVDDDALFHPAGAFIYIRCCNSEVVGVMYCFVSKFA